AVKRYDHYVGLLCHLRDDTPCSRNVRQVIRDGVGGKGYDADSFSFDVEIGNVFKVAARVRYAELVQNAFAALSSLKTEIGGVIVRQAHQVEAGIFKVLTVARRYTERITEPGIGAAFRGSSAFEHRPFQVAEGYVCGREYGRDINQHLR